MSKISLDEKDYTVVIDATEVGDPTFVLRFRITNKDVTNLNVSVTISNPDTQIGITFSKKIARIQKGEPIVVSNAFLAPVGAAPTQINTTLRFSIENEVDATFSLSPEDKGINNEFTEVRDNIFMYPDSPLIKPNFESLLSGKLYFLQCLAEDTGSKAFLFGNTENEEVSLKASYTNLERGMNWKIIEVEENKYLFQLDSERKNQFLYSNGESVSLSENGTIWTLSLDADSNTNDYILECQGDDRSTKLYLQGNTQDGTVSLSSRVNPSNRSFKWYFHKLVQAPVKENVAIAADVTVPK